MNRRAPTASSPRRSAVTPLLVCAAYLAAAGSERRRAQRLLRRIAEREQAFAHRASHDPLTGLPNRTALLEALERALARPKGTLAILFLDLDDFKQVNDTRGHGTGDLLLSALTPRLRAALRPGDTIARFGGDEFVVLCEDVGSAEDALGIAKRISRACARPVLVGEHAHTVTVSTGLVMVDPASATVSEVLRDADVAMYRAKGIGKGQTVLFEGCVLESELRTALEEQQFRLVYQPVVSLRRGEVTSVEALLRWEHPSRGLLEPAEFLAAAEATGLIEPIGEWVIREACTRAAAWPRPVPVSINLSLRQLTARADIAVALRRILWSTGMEPRRLEVEISERTLVQGGEEAASAVQRLKRTGVRVVLDDFGSAHASLCSLGRLPLDALKIDRSLLDRSDDALLRAMVGIADALDLDITAEGVETPGQLLRLCRHGCAAAQGHLLSAPLGAELLGQLLERSFAKPALSSCPAWPNVLAECSSTTASQVRPLRAAATRHCPAASV
jgi:diguanylate cyclase (GGDEF)-like protein